MDRGHHQRSIKGQSIYLKFDLMCNMPNFEAIVIKTNLEFCTSIKVIRDKMMVMRGHMIQNSKEVVTYPSVCMFLLYVLKCYVLRSSEVNEG